MFLKFVYLLCNIIAIGLCFYSLQFILDPIKNNMLKFILTMSASLGIALGSYFIFAQ